jgi:hypothetical protein
MGTFISNAAVRQDRFQRFQNALFHLHAIDLDVHGHGKRACELLQIESNVLTNWKRRGLPPEVIPIIAERAGINPSYILGLSDAMAVPVRAASNDSGTDSHSQIKHTRRG